MHRKIFLTMNLIDRQTHTKHNIIAKVKGNINKDEVMIKTLHTD